MPINHTLAPWKAPASQFGYVTAIDNYGNPVTVCTTRTEADARLIAAAPDMLAALVGMIQAMRKALPHLPADHEAVFCGEWLDEANSAIAKAKGDA